MGADELMRACAAWEREGDEGVLEEDDLRQLELLFEQTVIALADALRSLPMPGTPEIPHPAGAAQE
jgi:hypothetical protein